MPKMKMNLNTAGRLAFSIGVIIALIIGLIAGIISWTVPTWLMTIFFITGIVIGLLNISRKEATGFMVAILILFVVGIAGVTVNLPSLLGSVIDSMGSVLLAVLIPAGVIVAIKEGIVRARK